MEEKNWQEQMAALAKSELKRLPLPEELKLGWELYQNPLFVWAAIKECEELGKDYPKWVNKYLSESAEKLFKDIDDETKKGKPDIVLKDNLGFDSIGQGNIFSQYKNQIRNIRAFINLACVITDFPDTKQESILNIIANENHTETSIVRGWIHKIVKKLTKQSS